MILEYCQLLSTAHRVLDGLKVNVKSKTGRNVTRWMLPDSRENVLYQATHINHPSAVWVRQSHENYKWLHSLLIELLNEYTFRYGKYHKCKIIAEQLTQIPNALKNSAYEFSEPPPAMPDECKVPGDSIASYKKYYIMKKSHFAKWKNRSIPEWYNELQKKENETAGKMHHVYAISLVR